jgi:hypothetical protein
MLPRLYFLDGRTATALDNLRPSQLDIARTRAALDFANKWCPGSGAGTLQGAPQESECHVR